MTRGTKRNTAIATTATITAVTSATKVEIDDTLHMLGRSTSQQHVRSVVYKLSYICDSQKQRHTFAMHFILSRTHDLSLQPPKVPLTMYTDRKVVVVGSGWRGFEFIRRLPRRHSYDITVVSPRNRFVFTPLLASTCVGTLECCAIVESIRTVHEAHFFRAFARDIDLDKQHLLCTANDDEAHTHLLDYDTLVIACGAITNTFGIPGVSTHAYFLKDIEDARRIRKRVIDCFDRATEDENYALVSIAVVGGGPTGVELSAELHDLITQDLAYCYPKTAPFAKIIIYDVAPRILGAFDAKLAACAAQKFHREGIRVETGIGVRVVSKDSITLSDDRVVDGGMPVWATGLAMNALIKGLRVDKFTLRILASDSCRF